MHAWSNAAEIVSALQRPCTPAYSCVSFLSREYMVIVPTYPVYYFYPYSSPQTILSTWWPLPPKSPTSPFAAFPPFPFSFSSFPQIIMTIPIAVKDRTVSNKTVNDNTVINRIVTTNTVIASASKSLTSSIYTICWVFREYLSLQSVRMFSYIDDTIIVSDNTNSSGQ